MSRLPDELPPHRWLSERRRHGPVGTERVGAGDDGSSGFGVYSWNGVHAALQNPSLSADVYQEAMDLDGRYGKSLLSMDGTQHRDHRALLQATFSKPGIAARKALIHRPIDRRLASLRPRGSADLLTDLLQVVPSQILAAMLGLDMTAPSLLDAQAAVLGQTPEQAAQVADELREFLQPTITARRRQPLSEDLVSILAHSSLGGRPLSDDQVFSHVRLLAIAGTDTVRRATANLFVALLSQPDQLQAIIDQPALAGDAVEEAIRWECPAVTVPRVSTVDTDVLGHPTPAGSFIRCHLASANRDENRWDNPAEFDLTRPRRPHAGFGLGPHACIGIHLAREVMSYTLKSSLDQLPNLRLSNPWDAPLIAGDQVREPLHLRATWTSDHPTQVGT